MKTILRHKRLAILVGVLSLLWLSLWAQGTRSAARGIPVAVAASPVPDAVVSPARNHQDLAVLEKRHLTENIRDVFSSAQRASPLGATREQFRPPPPEIALPVVPAPTAPPALPFKYVGRMMKNGAMKVFVAKGDADYSIVEGDVLDETYRVESISLTAISFRYLPLDVSQVLVTQTDD